MAQIEWTLIAILSSILFTALFVWWLERYRKKTVYQEHPGFIAKVLRFEEKIIGTIHQGFQKWFKLDRKDNFNLQLLLELLLLGVWAFWVCRSYLDFNIHIVPSGREFNSAIQTHHLWEKFIECGWCAVWNGSARGGYPAFADIHGSMLHPIVILTTLIWGVVNGTKVALALSFWIAGIAQWWIARELRLGTIARLWSSGLVIVGGHLAGRMELGAFGVVLSTATASLVVGAVLALSRNPKGRGSVLLGIVTASAILSGQGYIQFGLLATFPAFGFLLFDNRFRVKENWSYYLYALIIALMLSAAFLVPFAHFSPNFHKFMDDQYVSAQPLRYIPLNYVINSFDFYHTPTLDKLPYPHLNTLFIGWIPILLAVYGLTDQDKLKKPIKLYLVGSILLILLFASGQGLKLLDSVWEMAAAIRHPSQIAGLTVPFVLSISAVGLEKLLRKKWPKISIKYSEDSGVDSLQIPTKWIILIPLLFSIHQGYDFSSMWIHVQEIDAEVYQIVEALKTDSHQWVQPPFGDHFYIEPGVSEGLKISPGIMTWRWKDRALPEAKLEASYSGQPEGTTGIIKSFTTISIYERSNVEYAEVVNNTQSTPCTATGTGGNIFVTCQTDHPGTLVIREYSYPGWKVWRDGKTTKLNYSDWLSTDAPRGFHKYTFRYLPWDVPLGIGFSLIGIILCVIVWKLPSEPGKSPNSINSKELNQ